MAAGGMEVGSMRIITVSLLFYLITSVSFAQPVITPTNFLNTAEPPRMCQDYIDREFGMGTLFMAQPSGGVSVKVDLGYTTRLLYVFCEKAFNRLTIFTMNEEAGMRNPVGPIRAYGLELAPAHFRISGRPGSFTLPYQGQAEKEHFSQPVDIAISSAGRYYDPEIDFIYVVDQGNMRIVKLRYDVSLDSLIWVDSFGSEVLEMPTAIDYADYGDSDPENDDILVTDGMRAKIFRFSRHGHYEFSYGGWHSTFGGIWYPTGIAVSASDSLSNVIYITDSYAHRVMRLISIPDGPIYPDIWHVFPLDTNRYVKGVDTDKDGNVYVIDNFTHEIVVFTPDLATIIATYGGKGHDPGFFFYPNDIYLDNNEIIVCEKWGSRSGIQSVNLNTVKSAPSEPEIPSSFFLYQNYPNPFNSTTVIEFDVPKNALTLLEVYNFLGQRVAVLLDETLEAGPHKVIWDGRNSTEQKVSSGVYIYRIISGEMQSSRKLVLLK